MVYNINALLPQDIAAKGLNQVSSDSHCRFDAIARRYSYHIYRFKDPFLADRAYYFPYTMDIGRLQQAAAILGEYSDYTAFSKRRTQVQTYQCNIMESCWEAANGGMMFSVKANRFLRGMVRGLVGTMLHVGRGKMDIDKFRRIIEQRNSSMVDFSVPAKGLFLREVIYPERLFE